MTTKELKGNVNAMESAAGVVLRAGNSEELVSALKVLAFGGELTTRIGERIANAEQRLSERKADVSGMGKNTKTLSEQIIAKVRAEQAKAGK